MDKQIIRGICLARYLYQLGKSELHSTNELALFSTVNLFHDAVEVFLITLGDFFKAKLEEKTTFDKYFVEINKKIDPIELPYKRQLLQLNKLRIGSKHHTILPERKECERLCLTVREFFEEICDNFFKKNFSSISTLELLHNGKTKDILIEAKNFLETKNYLDCSISCRKALYLEIEKKYDTSMFMSKDLSDGQPSLVRDLLRDMCEAPKIVKNEDFISKYVKMPTDYIIFDYENLFQKFFEYGIDPIAFWNLRRLTPEVVYLDNEWVVKEEFCKEDDEFLENNIDYIFTTTVDIILAIHDKLKHFKGVDIMPRIVKVRKEETRVYSKSATSSEIIDYTPKGRTEFESEYKIMGLDKKDYYHISYKDLKKLKFISGFIPRECIVE